MRKLAVTQTVKKNHQLTLVWKPRKEWNVNNNNNNRDKLRSLPMRWPGNVLEFANVPRYRGSIPGRVIPKTQKIVLNDTLLNTQHYKVRIKGKVEQSRESSTLPYTSVKQPSGCSRLRPPTLLYIYIHIYMYIIWSRKPIADANVKYSTISPSSSRRYIILNGKSISYIYIYNFIIKSVPPYQWSQSSASQR